MRRMQDVINSVEIKISRRVRAESALFFSTSTPSTRRLLDSVAVPVPHRSTEAGRPRQHPTHWLISTQASGKKLTHWVTGYGTGGTFHGAGLRGIQAVARFSLGSGLVRD